MKIRMSAILLTVLLCLVGCVQDTKEPIKVKSFELSEYSSLENTIPVGECDRLNMYIYPTDVDEESIELVNADENVAICLIQDIKMVAGKKLAVISFRGKGVGETTIYLKDINSDAQSEMIHIVVKEKQGEVDNSRKVYLNYSGDKYHFDYSCAGKSAYESTLNEATKLGKEPCYKCAK